MKIWPVQDAKARLSEFLEACATTGPQIVEFCRPLTLDFH